MCGTKKTFLVIICGPTASGKTALAADIAEKFGGEVINADSMQIYGGINIASAIPNEAERRGIPHHLFGIIEPERAFSVAQWLVIARESVGEISSRGSLPVVVGGTGLYITSLADNIVFDNVGGAWDFRGEMKRLADERGNAFLLEKLRETDPEAASKLHENNVKRVIRALETHRLSGKSMNARRDESKSVPSPYEICIIGIDFEDRKTLYDRINRRVDAMVSGGLVGEARAFYSRKNIPTASQTIGHKEFFPFFDGNSTLDECIENLKKRTRNYAKRQLTWFRRNKKIQWLIMKDETDYDKILKDAVRIIDDRRNAVSGGKGQA
ncbi:MAG: tRNA (adenosine(37)-N6)-dimethylallyltransferase MiaA [Oscillospiraceae bacterium]|jgi:tRNA dimethylallyltransferase|nr:tRNA (adenosine(37)-N6)-dimethylallyltransferase MiaA [Oscillospiraceae bacterium]